MQGFAAGQHGNVSIGFCQQGSVLASLCLAKESTAEQRQQQQQHHLPATIMD